MEFDDGNASHKENDYFCEVCECFMSGLQTYVSHINGKRHAKNVKNQQEGAPPSHVQYYKCDSQSELEKELRFEKSPVIGLNKISERHRSDAASYFNCHSCGGSFLLSTIVPHVLTTKHRMNIVKAKDPEWCEQISSMKLTKSYQDSLVVERAFEFEKKYGRGKVNVSIEKSCVDERSWKKFKASSNHHRDTGDPAGSTVSSVAGSSDEEEENSGVVFDLDKDSDMIRTDMKIEIMKHLLVRKGMDLSSELSAQNYLALIKKLWLLKMVYQVRQLTPHRFQKAYELAMAREPTPIQADSERQSSSSAS